MQRPDGDEDRRPSSAGFYIEDLLILLALVPLFILGVFYRNELWGQIGLGIVALVMLVVFIRRLVRAHRAFTEDR